MGLMMTINLSREVINGLNDMKWLLVLELYDLLTYTLLYDLQYKMCSLLSN